MPKIYFKSKDVQNIDVLQWNGVCYTRTGNYGTASKDSNIPLTDVIKFYGDCSTCEGGQVSLTPGTSTTVLSTAQQFQVMVPTLTSGQSTTLKFESDSSCDVVLSANASDQLVFDVESSGNGPHTFASVGDTINFESCDLPPLTYDVTYADTGSYILKFEQTTPALTANEGVDVENTFEDVELSELDPQELDDLRDVVSETVAEEYGVDPSQVETEFEEGSIRAITRIRRLYKYMVEQMQDRDTTSITNALTSMINSHPAIRPDIKQRMIQSVTTPPPLRISPVVSDNTVYIMNHGTLCFKASGTDLGGKVFDRKMYNNDCNTRLYMKDNQSMNISLNLDPGVTFDLFDSTGNSLRDTTEHYSVSGLPASGNAEVNISLTPGFTGNIHYKDTSNTITGNPGPHKWSVSPGGNGTIYVKSTVPKPLPAYHPTLRCQTHMSFGKLFGASREDSLKLANTISEVISGKMPLGSGEFKIRTSLTYTTIARRYMWGPIPYGYPSSMIGRGTKATTTIEFPEDVSKPVYDLAFNLLTGPDPSKLWSSLSADMKQTISSTDFTDTAMANDFSVNCYVGGAEQVKPVINCAQDVKECWDGTYLSRDPSNDCQFPPCPPEPRWFTRADMINNGVTTTAWLQCHGTKTVAQPQYNQLSAMQVESGGSVYMRVKNYTNCNNVVIDPLNQGLVAEKYIGSANPYKLYRDYFNLRDRWRRLTRTFVNQWSVYPNLSSCPGYVSDPIPTPTPTPTPTSPTSITYNINFTPQGTTGYSLSSGDNTWLPYWVTDGLNGHVEHISPTTMSPNVSSGWVQISFNDNIILTNPSHPSHPLGVKLLDLNGNVIWSQEGQRTLTIPMQSITNPNLAGAQSVEELVNYYDGVLYFEYYCTAHPDTMKGRIYAYRDNA